MESILEGIGQHRPDILAIQEYRDNSEEKHQIIDRLHHQGLTSFYTPPTESSSENKPAIAARWPFEVVEYFPNKPQERRHCIRIEFAPPDAEISLNLINLHLPHKKEQVPIFDYLLELDRQLLDTPSLLIGDINCGIPFEDSQTKTFENNHKFRQLLDSGWIDAWRVRNPKAREFTWISSRKQNGYRYDNALVSPTLNETIKEIAYDHRLREIKASDHSAMYLDVRFKEN